MERISRLWLACLLSAAVACGDEPPTEETIDPDDRTFHSNLAAGTWISIQGSGSSSSVILLEVGEPTVVSGAVVMPMHGGAVDHEGNALTSIGRFEVDEDTGIGAASIDRRHIFDTEKTLLWHERRGAWTEGFVPPEEMEIGLQTPGDVLVVESGDLAGEYHRLDSIFSAMEEGAGYASQAGAEQVVALFGVLTSLSKSRVDKWGGLDILEREGEKIEVDGLSDVLDPGAIAIEVGGNITETLSLVFYEDITDFFGLSIDGFEDTEWDIGGSGESWIEGLITYRDQSGTSLAEISLKIPDMEITGGIVTGGTAEVSTASGSFVVDATLVQNVTTDAILAGLGLSSMSDGLDMLSVE